MPEVSSEEQAQEGKKPSINLTDIVQCVEVLRVCTERGVWRASELSSVGQLYDRLTAFLTEAGISTEQDQPAEKE
jgi:hypothetical protein